MGAEQVIRPTLSITVPPAGQCYRLVSLAMDRMASVSLGHLGPPHFTLQTVYNEVDDGQAMAALRRIAQATEAFEAVAKGFDVLGGPQDPALRYIYVRVAKTAALAELYRMVKREYLAIGATTNPYDAQDWIPHLSIASGRWTGDQARALIGTLEREFGPIMLPCTFLVRVLQLHRMKQDGTWYMLGETALRNPSNRVVSHQ